MLAAILSDDKMTIGAIPVDVVIEETHTRSATIANHPLEDGSEVSDSVAIAPDRYSMAGIVSRAPATFGEMIQTPPFAKPDQTAYVRLSLLFESKTPFKVVSRFKTYERMLFTSFIVRRNKVTGEALNFTAEMQQITIVSSKIVEVPPPAEKPKAAPVADAGPKPTPPAPAPAAASSDSMMRQIGLGKPAANLALGVARALGGG